MSTEQKQDTTVDPLGELFEWVERVGLVRLGELEDYLRDAKELDDFDSVAELTEEISKVESIVATAVLERLPRSKEEQS